VGLRFGKYSNFGIAVDRNLTLKWLFPQEKATFQCNQKDHVNSEIALDEELKIPDSSHEVLRESRLAHNREGVPFFCGNFHEPVCGCISRKEQNFAFRISSLELDCQLDAVHLRHHHIGNQDAWATRLRGLQHLFDIRERGRLKAGRIQNSGDHRCGSRLIVHYEDSLRGVFCHGGILLHHAGRLFIRLLPIITLRRRTMVHRGRREMPQPRYARGVRIVQLITRSAAVN